MNPRLLAAMVLALGCSTPGAPLADGGPDAQPGLDVRSPTDAPPGADARPGMDAVPPGDARPGADVPAGADAPVGTDVPVGTDAPRADVPAACGATCPANAHCVAAACACDPGFVDTAGRCVSLVPGDPATRADVDLCAAWREGHRVTAAAPFTMGTGGACDPGTLSREALNDALRRLNFFRWMVGLTAVTDASATDQADQECSLMESLRGFPGPGNPDPHHPATDWRCYTAAGGTAAGMSNISWGAGSAADAIDNFMSDTGNETTMGHRRWILNPPLGPVGLGYYTGASCLGVFARSGGGTSGPWYAYPSPGPVPATVLNGYWTFHSATLGLGAAVVAVVRMADGMTLPVRRLTLGNGYGEPAIGWTPMGWRANAGDAFRVTVSGLTGAAPTVTYTVRAITCP